MHSALHLIVIVLNFYRISSCLLYFSWDYSILNEASPFLAGWFFVSFVFVGVFFLLSMFLAILSDSITEVRSYLPGIPAGIPGCSSLSTKLYLSAFLIIIFENYE